MKPFLLALLVIACTGAGFYHARRLTKKGAVTEDLAASLSRLKLEISFRAPPLGEAASKAAVGLSAPFWQAFAGGLKAGSIASAWEEAKGLIVLAGGETVEIMEELVLGLGMSDRKTQCERIEKTAELLEMLGRKYRQEAAQKGRVSKTLGVTVGCALCVLLL